MRLTYDGVADAAYIHLADFARAGEVAHTAAAMLELDRAFVSFDVDAHGRVLGIEILGASRVLRAEALRAAEQIG